MVARRTPNRSATSDWRRPSIRANRATSRCRGVNPSSRSARAGVITQSAGSGFFDHLASREEHLSRPLRGRPLARIYAAPYADPADGPRRWPQCGAENRHQRIGAGHQQALQFVALCESERRNPLLTVSLVQFVDKMAQPVGGLGRVASRADYVAEQNQSL